MLIKYVEVILKFTQRFSVTCIIDVVVSVLPDISLYNLIIHNLYILGTVQHAFTFNI